MRILLLMSGSRVKNNSTGFRFFLFNWITFDRKMQLLAVAVFALKCKDGLLCGVHRGRNLRLRFQVVHELNPLNTVWVSLVCCLVFAYVNLNSRMHPSKPENDDDPYIPRVPYMLPYGPLRCLVLIIQRYVSIPNLSGGILSGRHSPDTAKNCSFGGMTVFMWLVLNLMSHLVRRLGSVSYTQIATGASLLHSEGNVDCTNAVWNCKTNVRYREKIYN
jgi:hypothetical protein